MSGRLPAGIRFGRDLCGDLAQAERREWWLANGIGGYAAGTLTGNLTRRYHGLLIAPVYPPLGRWLVFAKADATLVEGERAWPLYTNRWGGGAVSPAGHVPIEPFHLEGHIPVWRYALRGVQIEQHIWMEQGANTTYVAFQQLPDALGEHGLQLRLRLLVNARDCYQVGGPHGFQLAVAGDGKQVRVISPGGVPDLDITPRLQIHTD